MKIVDFSKTVEENFKGFKDFYFQNKDEVKLYGKTPDGYSVSLFLKKAAKFYPDKIFKVYIYYEILDRLRRKEDNTKFDSEKTELHYLSTNQHRTLFISATSTSVIEKVESYIEEKGEIYHPKDPFALEFISTKIIIEDMLIESNFTPEERVSEVISGRKVCYELIPVKNLLAAVFLNKNNRRMSTDTNDVPTIQVGLKRAGYKDWSSFLAIPVNKQVEILNHLKPKKGTLFDIKIQLLDRSSIHSQEFKVEDNTLYLCFEDGLYLLRPKRISNLTFAQRPIMKRQLSHLTNDILIFIDTEWKWSSEADEQDAEIGSVKYPDILTYTIVYGADILKYGPDPKVLSNRSGYFAGKDCVQEFLEMVLNSFGNKKADKRMNVTCIAHNSSNIEHIFILTTITEKLAASYENYEIKLTHVTGTKVHSFNWKGIQFLDSMLFISGSLDKATKSLCKSYKKIEISKEELLETDWGNPSEKMMNYAMNDVYSLAEAWVRFNLCLVEIMNSNQQYPFHFSLTNFRSGASAMKWWLTDDVALELPLKGEEMDFEIKVKSQKLVWDCTSLVSLRNLVFMGGRCECGYIGTSKMFKDSKVLEKHKKLLGFTYDTETINTAFCISTDIVSSYPYVMVTEGVPGRVFKSGEFKSKEELDEVIRKHNNLDKIVYVYGNVKYLVKSNFPLLGIKIDGRLLFPNFVTGDYSVSFWDFEFNAIKNNIDTSCFGDYIVYNKYDGFNDKINLLFTMRKQKIEEKNEEMSYVLKILMNSGYGSLALNSVREVAYLVKGARINAILRTNSGAVVQDANDGFKWIIVKKSRQTNSLIFAASYITARARFNLWKEGMYLIEKEGAFLVYRDTDSHKFVDSPDKVDYYKKLYGGSKELGKWVYEGHTDDWEFATLKVYRVGDKVKYKSIKGTYSELVGEDGMIKRSISMVIWTRGRDGTLQTRRTPKRMSFSYDKGVVVFGERGVVFPLNL